MIYLFLSIICSSSLYLIFKLFERYNINLLQAIVTNYFVAALCGILLAIETEPEFSINKIIHSDWLFWAMLIGILFISIFNLMGISSQKSGIGITSIANKMSLVIPVLSGVVIFSEDMSAIKFLGLVMAICALILTTYKPDEKRPKKEILFPIIIFFSSGILDALVGYCNNEFIHENNSSTFTAGLFSFAFLFGLVFLFLTGIIKGINIELKNILGGILLGIPNFGSILFIFLALNHSGMQMTTFFPILNIGIVVCSFFAGILFFKEKITWLNIAGITAAIFSIGLIAYQ